MNLIVKTTEKRAGKPDARGKKKRHELEPVAMMLYSAGYSQSEISRILDLSVASVNMWYNSNKPQWEAAKSWNSNILRYAKEIVSEEMEALSQAAPGSRNSSPVDLVSKLNALIRDQERTQRETLEMALRAKQAGAAQIDRPALFIEHLHFIFKNLGDGTEAYRALAGHVDKLTAAYKDYVAEKADNRA